MSLFDGRRLAGIALDVDGLRRGVYSDRYFHNVVRILEALHHQGYTFSGTPNRPFDQPVGNFLVGDVRVEAQIFNRRKPRALVGGVDVALAMLRHAAGWFDAGQFVETWDQLDVEAVEDGVLTHYDGDPLRVESVLKICGRYRDFALLETTLLGVLTRISRIATNVYEVLQVCNGKPVLFFPARFDLPEVQTSDGYAYWLGVQRYNRDTGHNLPAIVSTDAQGRWWGGHGGGTVPHALIACFLGDTAESMLAFARYLPVEIPRIVLADFNNDSVRDSRAALDAFWPHYRAALQTHDETEMRRWTLNAVRLDTSPSLIDAALPPDSEGGVSPALVRAVRHGLDRAWESWGETGALAEAARDYCQRVQIVVTGGFNRDRIARFEREDLPVDSYGVGSSFLRNDSDTGTDFTMDIVRLEIHGEWVDMAKVGRQSGRHPGLSPVDLRQFG